LKPASRPGTPVQPTDQTEFVPVTQPRLSEDEYRPPNWRRRLWVGALALGTAALVLGYVTRRPTPVHLPPPRDTARCTPGQEQGCLGGSSAVFVVPATPVAPAAAASGAAR
jgi:hypothetical protein